MQSVERIVVRVELEVGAKKIAFPDSSMEAYLSGIYRGKTTLRSLRKLGEGFHNAGFLLAFDVAGAEKHLVLRVMRGDTGWGHDYVSDRAGALLLQHQLLNSAPPDTTSRSVDVVSLRDDGHLVSLGGSIEFLQLVDEITEEDGTPYVDDFFRMAKTGSFDEQDLERCRGAARYLANLHSTKISNAILYKRHIRDLVGHGEMLMGVLDTYPPPEQLDFTTREELEEIEVAAVRWRNRIKRMSHRLSRIHGDFHPFGNIRFRKDGSLLVSDFAREKFGEPADDVSSLSINYIFFSVWHYGEFKDPFKRLFQEFFRAYLEETQDHEILGVIAPFYAFRGLVVAHPLYYPDMERSRRRMILNFIHNVLALDRFEMGRIEEYLKKQ